MLLRRAGHSWCPVVGVIMMTLRFMLKKLGNVYYIQNIGKRAAKLFFAQARRIPAEELSETRATSEAESQGGS